MGKMTSAEDFVVAWATSRTIDDVVKTLGITKAAVQSRATLLRKHGVKLPKLTSTERGYDDLRIAKLNALINKHDIRKQR